MSEPAADKTDEASPAATEATISTPGDDPILAVESLQKRFGGITASAVSPPLTARRLPSTAARSRA